LGHIGCTAEEQVGQSPPLDAPTTTAGFIRRVSSSDVYARTALMPPAVSGARGSTTGRVTEGDAASHRAPPGRKWAWGSGKSTPKGRARNAPRATDAARRIDYPP